VSNFPPTLLQQLQQTIYNGRKKQHGWKGIPRNSSGYYDLIRPLTVLLNKIIRFKGVSEDRTQFLDTHNIISIEALPMSPSILLAGGPDDFLMLHDQRPSSSYMGAIAAVEVCLDSANPIEARDRLAVFVHAMFQNVPNRRFVYGLS